MGAEQSTPAPTGSDGGVAPAADARPPAAVGDQEEQGGVKALVVVGPSGVGKNTLIRRLLEREPERYVYSVSTTTRPPRPGEQDGVHYSFEGRDEMLAAISAGDFLEHAEVGGALYGTRRSRLEASLAGGRVPVLDLDAQGARQVRSSGVAAIIVFIAPPSLEELERRLRERRTEGDAELAARLAAAKAEISSLNEGGLYDYLLINEALGDTLERLAAIGERCARGLEPEPGHVPERVILEDEEETTGASDGGGGAEAAPAAAIPSGPAPTPAAAAEADGGVRASDTRSGGGGAGGATPPAPGSPLTGPAPPAAKPEAGSSQQPAPAAAPPPAAAAPAAAEAGAAAAGPPPPAASTHAQQPAAAALAAGLERWRGKVALVTGASSGIGWACCEALGRAGLRVVAAARRRERLEALQRHMLSPGVGVAPGDFLPVVCDVTQEAEVQALPRIVLKRWPGAGVDVLVNNAGLSRSDACLFDGNTASWVEMAGTNLLGGAMVAREVVRDMKRRGQWGHIFMMVGLSGHRIPDAAAGGSFFAATKFGVRALTEGLRQEARAAGVPLRVSGVSPGLVATEFFTVRAFGDEAKAAAAVGAFKQVLQPGDVAGAILWALGAPDHMEVNDVIIRPTEQVI